MVFWRPRFIWQQTRGSVIKCVGKSVAISKLQRSTVPLCGSEWWSINKYAYFYNLKEIKWFIQRAETYTLTSYQIHMFLFLKVLILGHHLRHVKPTWRHLNIPYHRTIEDTRHYDRRRPSVPPARRQQVETLINVKQKLSKGHQWMERSIKRWYILLKIYANIKCG